MNIGNQIKALRLKKAVTQEAMAEHFGMTAQAVSKWECGTSVPDISLLPELSAYFGVTIDALFALDDETRMERIQNMLWDERYLNPSDVENERKFLLEKARREPENGRPHELLADMEVKLSQEHKEKAAEYAMEALRRNPDLTDAHSLLVQAMNGYCPDWCETNHAALIRYYEEFMEKNPENWHGMMWLMDQLIDSYRFNEAEKWLGRFEKIDITFRAPLYRGALEWHRGNKEEAYRIWEALCEQYPERWSLPDIVADYLARDQRYDESIAWRRKALSVAKPPRYVDPIVSIAQILELQGDFDGAIAAREEELEMYKAEWNFIEGETADAVRRDIARLKKRLESKAVG